ncbi:MAG: RagB/SusD family nutrient uptake outer membrane protein [Agriterribacter sp.]
MKKSIIFFSIFSLLITSCNKKLDLTPSTSVAEDEVFTSDANIKAALNGAYDAASSSTLLGGDLLLYSELLGADEEIQWVGTYNQPREIFNKAILTNNSFVTDTWDNAYKTINICNNIIKAIDIVDETDRDRVKGEALFLRGVMYFELVTLYAKPYSAGNVESNPGVQIVLTPTSGNITEANYVARSSVKETFDQVLADLKDAKSLLPTENGVYATTYAASAFLSRVYLQMEDYANARDEANTVIEDGGFELTSTYDKAFNNTVNSTEDIFAIQVSDKDGSNDMHLFWSIPEYSGRDGDVDVEQKHIDLYESSDARLALFYIDDQDIYRSGKWKLNYKNLPIVRLGEMYLTRAECNFRLSTDTGATPEEDINDVIRARVGLDPITIDLDNIIKERHLELAHEGQRIQDIKRLKESVDGFDYDANELVFPIPVREVNASNGALTQNPGY